MIVECEKCKSKFNLNPDLVKPTGTIVRCSICKNIFVVHPEVEKEEPQVFEEKKEEDLDQLFNEIGYGEAEEKKEKVAKEEEAPEQKLFKDLLGEEKEALEEKGPVEESTKIIEEEPKQEVSAPKKKGSKLIILLIVIGVFLIGGFAAALIGLSGKGVGIDLSKIFASKTSKQSPDDPGNKKLSLFNVSGKFVKNPKTGTLFVVTGTVKNKYSGPRSHILVKANLLDSKGNVLKFETAYAGNIISEADLEKLTLEEITAKMKNMSGDNNSNVNIEPNGTREFMVVFSNIPANVSEFTVQALESKPAEVLKK